MRLQHIFTASTIQNVENFRRIPGHIVMISEEEVVVKYVANKAKDSIVLYSSS